MDLPEADIAANPLVEVGSVSVGVSGRRKKRLALVLATMGWDDLPLKARVNQSPGTPYAPQSPQVEGSGQHAPFRRQVHQAPQGESLGPICSLRMPKTGSTREARRFRGCLRPASRHPLPMIPQHHVVGSHSQGRALGTVLGTHTEGGTGSADICRAQVKTHSCLFAPHVAGEGRPLTLRASVTIANFVLGETVLVVPAFRCLGSVLRNHHLKVGWSHASGWFPSNNLHRPASAPHWCRRYPQPAPASESTARGHRGW